MIEPAAGLNRSMLAFLCDAYFEEVVGERERTVLQLHPQIAPVKAAVLPLIPRDSGQAEKARALYEELRRVASSSTTTAARSAAATAARTRSARRSGFTIDEQTLVDDTITVRDRDSLEQERISIAQAQERSCSTVSRPTGRPQRAP